MRAPPTTNESRAPIVLAVAGTLLSIAWLAVSLRVWVRAMLLSNFGWDDAALIFTNVVYSLFCCFLLLLNTSGGGTHVEVAELPKLATLTTYFVACEACYIVTTVMFKIALGMFYLRIATRSWHRRLVYATVAFSTVFGIAYLFLVLFQCGAAPEKIFQRESAGKCIPFDKVFIISVIAGVVNTVTDWILGLLPIFVLRQAQLERAAKISAGFVLVLGSIGSICSAIRLAFLRGLRPGPHFFWTAVDIAVWSVAEPGIGIVAASLATLRPLFQYCNHNSRSPSRSAGAASGSSRKHSAASEEGLTSIEYLSCWHTLWPKSGRNSRVGGLTRTNLDSHLQRDHSKRNDINHADAAERRDTVSGHVRTADPRRLNNDRPLPPLPLPLPIQSPPPPSLSAMLCPIWPSVARPPSLHDEKWLTRTEPSSRPHSPAKQPTRFDFPLPRPTTMTAATTRHSQTTTTKLMYQLDYPESDRRKLAMILASDAQRETSLAFHSSERPMSDASSRYSQTPSDEYDVTSKMISLQKAERREASVMQGRYIPNRKVSSPYIVDQDGRWSNSRLSLQRPLQSATSQRRLCSSRIPRPKGYAATQTHTV